MAVEIWASDSGNMLAGFRRLDDALAWARTYWLREGDEALTALSVGGTGWALSGDHLREALGLAGVA